MEALTHPKGIAHLYDSLQPWRIFAELNFCLLDVVKSDWSRSARKRCYRALKGMVSLGLTIILAK
jgi:hypothetical protein